MFAMDFYLSACRCVMNAEVENPESWAELYRLIPCLRQSLTCYVCFNLLYDPIGPTHNVCKHLICSKCVGGKMKLKPSCSWCKDQWDFKPNSLIKILVHCFKKLCICIHNSPLGDAIQNSTQNGEKNDVLRILNEVLTFNDDYVPNSYNTQQLPQVKQEKHTLTCDVKTEPNEPGPSSNYTEPSLDHHLEPMQEIVKADKDTHVGHKEYLDDVECVTEPQVGRGKRIKQPPRKLLFSKTLNPPKKAEISRRLKRKAIHLSKQKKGKRRLEKLTQSKLVLNEPMALEKIDNLVPQKKRPKQELSPPELKPLSFCKCGKSGNFNQLTCLGQRCACYSMKLPCIGCKCKGCRNPKKGPENAGGNKSPLSSSVLRSGTRSLSDIVCVSL